LYFGDNLKWLADRKEFPDASVALVYLDPPFNSNADYNVLFREPSGQVSQAQFHAFTDTWSWADAADTYHQFIDNCQNVAVVELMEALHSFLKHSPMMAYLAMMAPRLVELQRILKSTGSLYLHCDPTASHYLRMLLDGVFGAKNFRNEISWKRSQPKSHTTVNFPNCRDVIFRYSKSESVTFNKVYGEHDPDYIEKFYRFTDPDGRRYRLGDITNPNKNRPNLTYEFLGVKRVWRWTKERMQQAYEEGRIHQSKPGAVPQEKRYLDEMHGQPISDSWDDIEHLHGGVRPNFVSESLGYPTQKPQALLERIISASSNPGDLVLDPFCGCGTTIHAAQKLDRQWIGIDITYLAINLIKRRLKDAFGEEIEFEEKGQPTDFESAKRLAELDKFQFQHWALSLIGARPLREGEGKGADRGVDGLLYYYETERKDFLNRVREDAPSLKTEEPYREKIIVQVKGGGVNRGDVATLLGDVENQKAAGGVLITLEKPSKQMRTEAADAGRYTSKLWHDKDYPRIQILTVEGLLNGTERTDAPPQINPFAMAAREQKQHEQAEML
jgi:site-specific DNA-methyltransferase (adenine-specific)